MTDLKDAYERYLRGAAISDDELNDLLSSAVRAVELCDLFDPGLAVRMFFLQIQVSLGRMKAARGSK